MGEDCMNEEMERSLEKDTIKPGSDLRTYKLKLK